MLNQSTKRNYTPGPASVSMNTNMIRIEDRRNVHEQINDFFGRNGVIKQLASTDRVDDNYYQRFRISHAGAE